MRNLTVSSLLLVLLISQVARADIVQVLSPTQLVIPAGDQETVPVQVRVLEPEPAQPEATTPEPAAGQLTPPSGGEGQGPALQTADDQQDGQEQENEQTANGDTPDWRDLRVATVEASHGGQPIEPSAFQVTWQPEGATTRGVLRITVDETKTGETGAYPIKIEITRGQQPELQDLELTLTRPAAAVGAVQPIKFERIVTLPWWIALQPATVPIEETTGKAALGASSEKSLIALQQDGRLVGNLTATLPGEIAPGAKGTLAFASADDLPLGDSSGSLTLRAPQLAEGKTVLSIEVSSRWSRFWIVPPLMLGILAGFFVRVVQDRNRIRAEARLGLAQEGQRIEGLIAATRDEAHREALTREHAKLAQEWKREAAEPEEITRKVSEVRAAVDKLLAEFAQDRTTEQTKLDQWRAAMGVLETGVPELDEPLRRLRAQREELAVLLAEGWLGKVKGSAEDELTKALDAFLRIARGWQGRADGELRRVEAAAWPDTDLQTMVERTRDASTKAGDALGAGPAKDQLAAQIAAVRVLTSAIQTGLADALQQVSQLCQNVGKELVARKNPALEQPLAELEEEARALDAIAAGLKKQGNTAGLAACLKKLQERYQAVLARAREANKAALEAPAAANAAVAEMLRGAALGLPGVREGPVPGDWHLEIAGADEARVGGEVELRAAAGGADDLAGPVRFVWTVEGRPVAANPADPARLRFRPDQPGRAVVRVEAVSLASGERRAAERVLDVLSAPELPSIADQLATIRRADYLQTGVAGVIVAVIGYTIFAPTFVGGLLHLVGPFFWGFGADLGLAKVREYSQPLLDLKPSFSGVRS